MENGKSDLIDPNYYKKSDAANWQGRVDGSDHDQLRLHQCMQLLDLSKTEAIKPHKLCENPQNIAFLGFACDEGVKRNKGREGSIQGPTSIRKALCNLPKQETNLQVFDAGDIHCPNQNLEAAQHQLGLAVELLLKKGYFPIVLGGGHEVTFGHYLGIRQHLDSIRQTDIQDKKSHKKLGLINFDAHFDNRALTETGANSGTGFWQIRQKQQELEQPFHYLAIGIQKLSNTLALFNQADQSDTQYIYAEDFLQTDFAKSMDRITHFITENDVIYLTLDLDVFASAYVPGVSAPAALGLIPNQRFFESLNLILESKKVISLDIAELNPNFDQDERSAKFAAALIFHILNKL